MTRSLLMTFFSLTLVTAGFGFGQDQTQPQPQRLSISLNSGGVTQEVQVVPGQPGVYQAQPLGFSPDLVISTPSDSTATVAPGSGSSTMTVVRPDPPGRNGKPRMVPTLPKEYEAKDKNGDGQIGMYEWDRSKYAEFVKLDKNGDGFLTPQELNAKGSLLGARRGSVSEKDALPYPGSLTGYAQRLNESFSFLVTGQTGGPVYGTGTYTTDSSLAAAAVHAGILKAGETGVVTVTIVESPNQFSGTAANGVTSNSWGSYPSAYTIR